METLAREAHATELLLPGRDADARRRDLHDLRASGGVEHSRMPEEPREGLAIVAVAEHAIAGRGRHLRELATQPTTRAPKRELIGHGGNL
jgi:hypothetical protein